MNSALVLGALATALLAFAVYLFLWPHWRQQRLLARPFPEAWQQQLATAMPLYRRLPVRLRQQLHGLIHLFLSRIEFVGCGGLTVDDTMRLSIAAQASLLLLNQPEREFLGLFAVYLYPTAFRVEREEQDEAGVVSRWQDVLLGESWGDGRIILAWDEVAYGASNDRDGCNVVLHEFAHHLDHSSGFANGTPGLRSSTAYRDWAAVMTDEYARLQQDRGNMQSVLDPYGAEDPAEFFAVATEAFFEDPIRLARYHPALYGQLQAYYGLDPQAWK